MAHMCLHTSVTGSSLPYMVNPLEHSPVLIPLGDTKGAHSRLSTAFPLCAVRALSKLVSNP